MPPNFEEIERAYWLGAVHECIHVPDIPLNSQELDRICLLIIFKINFYLKNSSRDTIRVSDSFDPDQARHNA